MMLALALAIAPAAGAASPLTPYDLIAVDSPDPQPYTLPAANGGNRFPERLMDAADLTGDGVRDVFAAAYKVDLAGRVDAGVVFLLNGATRRPVYQLNPPELEADAQFGFNIAVLSDISGDGRDDLVVGAPYKDVYTGTGGGCGAPEPNGCNENQGRAYVFSGATGRLLHALDNPNPQPDEGVFATFGARLGSAGDITGDGRPELIVGSPANDVPAGCGLQTPIPAGCRKNEGEAFIFNGVTGALVRTLRVPAADRQEEACTTTSSTSRCGNLSTGQSPGDVNRDGVPDQAVAAYSLRRPNATAPTHFGRVYVFSGATGAVLSRIDQPEPDSNAFWGLQDVAPNTPGDVNGDGAADVYVTGFNQDGRGGEASAGRGWVFDGAASVAAGSGVILWEPRDPTPQASEAFGWAASRTDYNRDGRPDLYLSGLQGLNTETYVFDGRDGSLLRTLALAPSEVQPNAPGNNGSALGWSSRAPGDLNGDGEPDFVAAAPFQDVGANQDQGRLYFFVSRAGGATPPPPPRPGATAPPPPPAAAAVKHPAKLSLARARLLRRDRALDVLAPITSLASGRVAVELHAASRRTRFEVPIDSRDGRIRFRRAIPAAQAEMGTGILTIRYPGDADTRPQEVRLRAAAQRAELSLSRPTLAAGRLRASGTISRRARGVVRLQVQYVVGGETVTLAFHARIAGGRWTIDERLSAGVLDAIARRTGTVHSYTLFTGYLPARMRGEMRSFQILGAR